MRVHRVKMKPGMWLSFIMTQEFKWSTMEKARKWLRKRLKSKRMRRKRRKRKRRKNKIKGKIAEKTIRRRKIKRRTRLKKIKRLMINRRKQSSWLHSSTSQPDICKDSKTSVYRTKSFTNGPTNHKLCSFSRISRKNVSHQSIMVRRTITSSLKTYCTIKSHQSQSWTLKYRVSQKIHLFHKKKD